MPRHIKKILKGLPIIGALATKLDAIYSQRRFKSADYWQSRYLSNGNSGAGSYGHLAEFKASVINNFVSVNNIQSIIEFGCGDGNQLTLAHYPTYIGLDVSREAIRICNERFAEDEKKSFHELAEYRGQRAEMAMSLDVIYHLIEDDVYGAYMARLFDASTRYVAIYSSDMDSNQQDLPLHLKHRKFTQWIEVNRPEWSLIRKVANPYPYNGDSSQTSFSDFYFYALRVDVPTTD